MLNTLKQLFAKDRKPPIPNGNKELDHQSAFRITEAVTGWDYKNHFNQTSSIYNKFANPFWYYEQLIEELCAVDDLRITPLFELLSCEDRNKRLIGLRHDIDMDPENALRCARHLTSRGICGSFYLLHTNPYYGVFHGDYFIRNPLLKEWVLGFIVAGCEIGLHNDALHVYLNWGVDGIDVIRQEIAWLRAQGAMIRGTVAHNSGPIYGAENYEIFEGRCLWQRELTTISGRRVPLGTISERALNLNYEGTFAKPKTALDIQKSYDFMHNRENADVRSESWMRDFLLNNPYCDYQVDFQFWLLGKDMWVMAGRDGVSELYEFGIRLERVVEIIKALPVNSRSLMVIHPEYVRGERIISL